MQGICHETPSKYIQEPSGWHSNKSPFTHPRTNLEDVVGAHADVLEDVDEVGLVGKALEELEVHVEEARPVGDQVEERALGRDSTLL